MTLENWKRRGVEAAMIAAMVLGVFFLSNQGRSQIFDVQSVTEKVTFTADEGGSSVSERRQFWEQAWELSKEHPILGWGPYSFRFIQPRLQTSVLATSDHPHNVFLKLLVETGWPGMVLFLGILFTVLYGALRKFQIPSSKLQTTHCFLTIGVLGVLAHNLIDYNLQFVGIALPFCIFLGIIAVVNEGEEREKLSTEVVRYVEIFLMSAFLLIALIEGGFLVVSSLGRHAEAAGDRETALVWYDRASLEKFSRDMHLSRAKILFDQKLYGEALSAVDTYQLQNGQDARGWVLRGEIALAGGNADDALGFFDQAAELARFNDLRIARGQIESLILLKNVDELAARKAPMDDLLEAFADGIIRNIHFVALSPNVEEYLSLSGLLAERFPDDAPRYQVRAARVDHQAELEREKIEARPPGFLW